jgi:hypothetical protein
VIHLFFTILMGLGSLAQAGTHYNFNAAFRTDPRANNLTATMAYDGLLRGEASPATPFYSYYRVGAKLGGSPTAAAFLQYAPVAPLIFEVQQSTTQRFMKSSISKVDCNLYECQGNVNRTDYIVKAIVAYQKVFLLQNLLWRNLKTADVNRPVFLEQENFIISPGTKSYYEATTTIGYRLKYQGFNILLGAGDYRSDQPEMNSNAAVAAISYSFGESLSLF